MSFLMLNPARISRVSFLASSALAALFAFSFAACDSGVDDADCCLAEPVCDPGYEEVDTCVSDACITVEACCSQKLCEPLPNCDAAPTCQPNEIEVATCDGSTAPDCHAVEMCGNTIFCESAPPCEAVPSCDEGDEEQPNGVCPDDGVCYTTELCGISIVCLDNGLAHGCPDVPPSQGEPCSQIVTCEYPIEDGCFDIWSCGDPLTSGADEPGAEDQAPIQALEWQSGGTVCPREPN